MGAALGGRNAGTMCDGKEAASCNRRLDIGIKVCSTIFDGVYPIFLCLGLKRLEEGYQVLS